MGFGYDWMREIAAVPSGILRPRAKDVSLFPCGWARLPQGGLGQLGPGREHGLANEQVIDGRGWRSGAIVEKRLLSQWFFRITAFTEELLDALGVLECWPERVRLMQEKWIGRSEGARLFAIAGEKSCRGLHDPARYAVWRLVSGGFAESSAGVAPRGTRPGSRRLHRRVQPHGDQRSGDRDRRETRLLDGLEAIHPFDESRYVPVYVANFVLMEYGTGAIFGCPAHDQRDLEFAHKYALPVIPVVLPPGEDPATFTIGDTAYVEDGTLFNSGFLTVCRLPTPSGPPESGSNSWAAANGRSPTGCATGGCRGSVIGDARSP